MAWTQTDLDRIERAIATGTLEVRTSDGRRLIYRSVEELLKAKAVIEAELDKAAGTNKSRTRRISTSQGY